MFVEAELYLELCQTSIMELVCKDFEQLSAIFAENLIIDVRLGSKFASEKTENLKMKLRLARSS